MNEDNSQALSQIEPEPLPHEDTKPPDQPFLPVASHGKMRRNETESSSPGGITLTSRSKTFAIEALRLARASIWGVSMILLPVAPKSPMP